MNPTTAESKVYLANLLEAIERCVFFLHGSASRIDWPIDPDELASRNKYVDLFETLSAINESFSKLQDTLGSAMRHAALLSAEPADTFLRVLCFFEKVGVITSIDDWQAMRALRNLAAHQYETNYKDIAEHFNSLEGFIPSLYATAAAFSSYCLDSLGVKSASDTHSTDFIKIVRPHRLPADN